MSEEKRRRTGAASRRVFLILAVLALSMLLFSLAAEAKNVKSLTVKKGECYNIILHGEENIGMAREAVLKVRSSGTKYDAVFYTGSVAQSAWVRLGSTKSETIGVMSGAGGLPPVGTDSHPSRTLFGRIFAAKGSLAFSIEGWRGAAVPFEAVKETKKSEKKVLQEYTLKKGEIVTFTKKSDKGYAMPSLDIIIKAKTGTTVTFSGSSWKQTVKFNSASAAVETINSGVSSGKEKWAYLKKSGKDRYLEIINISETGKTEASAPVSILTPYAESLYQKIHKAGKKASGGAASAAVTCRAEFHSSISDKDVELTYQYSDDWFLKDHTALDKNIAKASMALAGAAYSESNAKAALGQKGAKFDILNSVYPKITRKDNDKAGYVIARRKIGSKNLYLVMVRGTTRNAEWYSNFNIGTDGKKHRGFYKAAGTILTAIEKELKKTKKATNILWITGHSRGAALAGILAGRISTEAKYENLVAKEHLFAYTFASPTYALKADTSLKNIYNFCNEGDMVTQVPPSNYKFKRFGQTITIKKAQQSKIKERFQYLAGVKYTGYMTTPAAVKAMAKWIGKPKNYEKKTKVNLLDYLTKRSALGKAQILTRMAGGKYVNFSKYEIMLALAVFLQSEEDKVKDEAVAKLLLALNTGQLPVEVAALYLGENAAKTLTSKKITGNTQAAARELAQSPAYIAHAHCQELYYAWVEVL